MIHLRLRHVFLLASVASAGCALDDASELDAEDIAEDEPVAATADGLTAGPVVKRFVAQSDVTVVKGRSTDADVAWGQAGRYAGDAEHRTYLRFKVEGLSAAARTATLRLYVDRLWYAKTRTSHAYAVSNTWNEYSLVWTTAPALGTKLSSRTFTTPALDMYQSDSANLVAVDLDVSSLVKGNGTFSVAVTGTPTATDDQIRFPSRKGNLYGERASTSAQRPHLTVTTDGTATSATRPLVKTWPTATLSGSTYTASAGTWTGSSPAYRYQWQRCDLSAMNKGHQHPALATCVDVSGATASKYVKTSADTSRTLRVVVTATNAAGTDTAHSAAR